MMRIERQTSGRYLVQGTKHEVTGYGAHLEANGYRQMGALKCSKDGNCRAVYIPGQVLKRKGTDRYSRAIPPDRLTVDEVARNCEALANDCEEDETFLDLV